MSAGDSNQEAVPDVPEEKLHRLLGAYGVAAEFIEFSGNVAKTPLENRLRILSALGISIDDEAEVDRLLAQEENRTWADWLEPVILLHEGQREVRFACRQGDRGDELSWQIRLEDGEVLEHRFTPAEYPEQESREVEGQTYSACLLPLPELPLGYHQLTLSNNERWVSSLLIVAPRRAHEPQWLVDGRQIWGLTVQLYSICSRRNWGMGDFGDLRQLITLAAGEGADFIQLNPLHALDNREPENASPYSPTDRRFLNPLYINIEQEEDFRQSHDAADMLARPEYQEVLAQLRQRSHVDYTGVFRLKYRIFDLMYRQFRERHREAGTARAKDFDDYVQSHGEAMRKFARFQASIPLDQVEAATDPEFHLYLQWLAERQLGECQALAREQGMKLGLIRDLAVGGGSDSCEVMTNPELFCLEARIGAPPDNFNPDGQNWGLPPMRPDILRQTRFEHFINLLRGNMTPCGALRIDHVMSLMRLWWCPTDGTNASGAYVHYPVDELFAILRLESRRAGCLVIGEDLGVVPPEIRRYIDESGVLSNVIFYFEKYDGWHFKLPHDYPTRALAFVANHDVPPLKAWWNRDDLRLRHELGMMKNEEQLVEENDFRQQEKHQVLHWLDECQLLPESWQDRDIDRPFDVTLGAAIFRCCARSHSQLVAVQIDDVAGMDKPVNIPGTSEEYPNWRRKVTPALQDLFDHEDTHRILSVMHEERP